MARRIAIVLFSFASIAGAGGPRAQAFESGSSVRFEVTVLVPTPVPVVVPEGPNPGDLKALGRRDLDRLRAAGLDPRELAGGRGEFARKLYKDHAGEVYVLPARRTRGLLPESVGVNLND